MTWWKSMSAWSQTTENRRRVGPVSYKTPSPPECLPRLWRLPKNQLCRKRVHDLLAAGTQVMAPSIAVYENRRELVHLQLRQPAANRLTRFDTAVATLGLLRMTEEVMERAAYVWGDSRHRGIVTADPK